MKKVLFLFLTICVTNISYSENGPIKKKKKQVIATKQKSITDEVSGFHYEIFVDSKTGKKDTMVVLDNFLSKN